MLKFVQPEHLPDFDGPDVRATVSLPLPPDAGLELLEDARLAVLDDLCEITSWKAIIHGPRAGEVHEHIRSLAQTLSEIVSAIQKVSEEMESEIMREVPVEGERMPQGTDEPGPSEEEIPF
jgi:hypothetical protein